MVLRAVFPGVHFESCLRSRLTSAMGPYMAAWTGNCVSSGSLRQRSLRQCSLRQRTCTASWHTALHPQVESGRQVHVSKSQGNFVMLGERWYSTAGHMPALSVSDWLAQSRQQTHI